MTLQQFEDIVEYLKRELGWVVGLIAAVAGAAAAIALPEPWHDRAMIIAVLAAAASGYMLTPFRRRAADDQTQTNKQWSPSPPPKE